MKKQTGKQKAYHAGFDDGLHRRDTVGSNPDIFAGKPHKLSYANGYYAGAREHYRRKDRSILQIIREFFHIGA